MTFCEFQRADQLLIKEGCLCRVNPVYFCPALWDSMDCSPPAPSVHGVPRQEYWSGLPFPSPGDLPNPGIEPMSPALAGGFLAPEPPGKRSCNTYLMFVSFIIGFDLDLWFFGHPRESSALSWPLGLKGTTCRVNSCWLIDNWLLVWGLEFFSVKTLLPFKTL